MAPEQEGLFVDEATVRRHPTLAAQWCLGEAVPDGPTGDNHTKGHVDGAVAPLPGRPHAHIGAALGKQECAKFLRHLLPDYRDKRLRVLQDRGEHHTGPPGEAILRDADGRLVLKPQPAYSPELKPAERLWKWMRRVVTQNHGFETLQEDIQAMRNFFCYLAGRRAEVRRLCTLKIPESLLASL